MRFGLSDEQVLLRDAARQALAGAGTLAAARAALDEQASPHGQAAADGHANDDEQANPGGNDAPDAWPLTRAAGWPGALTDPEAGGAGLGALEAMVIVAEAGRVLASTGLLGHLPATLLLSHGGADLALLRSCADGSVRAAAVLARPPGGVLARPPGAAADAAAWTGEPASGFTRVAPLFIDSAGRVHGTAAWIPDAAGADALVVVCVDSNGRPRAALLREPPAAARAPSYDASRPLAHLQLRDAPAEVLDCAPESIAWAWQLAQGLIGAEALGAAEALLESSVAHAKRREAFGRAIGSFQAVKHQLVEVLRQVDNAHTLMLYAGWSERGAPADRGLLTAALRHLAGTALDTAARTAMSVHGGMGVTWEHDAPLYFRRAQVTRRLLGGNAGAAEAVGAELLARARAHGS